MDVENTGVDVKNVDTKNVNTEIVHLEPVITENSMNVAEIVHENGDNDLEEGEIDDDDSNGVKDEFKKETSDVKLNSDVSHSIKPLHEIDQELDCPREDCKGNIGITKEFVEPVTETVPVPVVVFPMDAPAIVPESEKLSSPSNEPNSCTASMVKIENEHLIQPSNGIDRKSEHFEVKPDKIEDARPKAVRIDIKPVPKEENNIPETIPNGVNDLPEATNHTTESDDISKTMLEPEKEPPIENEVSAQETLANINEHVNVSEHESSKQSTESAQDKSLQLLDNVLNTSGSKSVKNISTSSKDYLIVENDNNETTIYITRKKKKKKEKKEKKEKREKKGKK